MVGCGVGPVSVQHISDTLCNSFLTCNITKLNLSDNEQVQSVSQSALPLSQSYTHSLAAQIGPEGAESLAAVLETNKVLQHLALNNCDIGDRGLEALATGKSYHSRPLHFSHSPTLQLCVGTEH